MSKNSEELYRFDEFTLDPSKREVERNNTLLALSPKAFEVLTYLVRNPGRVVTKEELLRAVWPDSFVEESNLAQHISWLRKAMTNRSGCIATIPGRGYQFTAKVQTEHSVETLPESQPGDIYVQRVRERTHVVIENLQAATPVLALPAGSRQSIATWWVGVALMAGAISALAGHQLWNRLSKPSQLHKVMVADFANTTGDSAFDHTLKRALEIDLEQSPSIDVMSQRETVSTLRLMGLDSAATISSEKAREVCERSNREVLLLGQIAQVGQEFLITLEATDCVSGKRLTSAKAETKSKEKVLAALDSVADRLRSGLGESTTSLQTYRVPIMTATTSSLEALKSYSIGQSMDAQGKSENETLPFYQRAVELDPQFAMAYGAMATNYYNLSEMNLASQFYKKAFDLSDRVSTREKLILRAHYYADGLKDVRQGIDAYRQWAAIYPNDWAPRVDMANEYTQLGDYPPAIAAGEEALKLEPNRAINYSVLIRAYKRANRFAEAKAIGLKAIERKKDSSGVHGSLYEIAVAEKDVTALAQEAKWASTHKDGWYGAYFAFLQAEASAAVGKYRAAEDLFRNAVESANLSNMPETGDNILLSQAAMELEFDQFAAAQSTLRRTRNLDPNAPDLALLQIQMGNTSFAERFVADHGAEAHPGTLMEEIYLPRVRAGLDGARKKPQDAVETLERVRPYELADYELLTQTAKAFLQSGRPDQAALEYQKIISNPGVDPLSILYPLAHLGLARVYATEKNNSASRKEYENFFEKWKDADADAPVLKEARLEYSHIN